VGEDDEGAVGEEEAGDAGHAGAGESVEADGAWKGVEEMAEMKGREGGLCGGNTRYLELRGRPGRLVRAGRTMLLHVIKT